MNHCDYAIIIEPATTEDGGGFLAYVPDLPGCMSDGDTYEQAAHNVAGAIESWIEAALEMGRPIPQPTPRRALA
jgi:predicted RNase H-like HicB family nuclease